MRLDPWIMIASLESGPNGAANGAPHGPPDWQALKRDILAKLDVCAEFEALGVEFTRAGANARGLRECRAFGRPDADPSAFVNASTGVYHDSGGEGTTLDLFDFALRHGQGQGLGRWIDAIKHYAAKAGVPVGKVEAKSGGRILEDRFDYRDAAGEVRYAVFRYKEPNGKKSFTQHPPDGRGGWKYGEGCMDGVQPLPYRLPEILAAPMDETVWIAEGEKCVRSLVAEGLVATTNHKGANATAKTWPVFLEHFRGRRCVILPDHDAGGWQHALRVAEYLKGVASSVKVVELPGLGPRRAHHGLDVSDWLDGTNTVDVLRRLADAAPEWEPGEAGGEAAVGVDDPERDATVADLRRIVSAEGWLWPLWIPGGALSLLASEAGTGKTRFVMDLHRRMYHGLPWPDGSPMTVPPGGRCLWVVADNQWREMCDIPPAFGIPDEAIVVNARASDPFDGTSLQTAEELADFEARIVRVKPALVVIDTITNTSDLKSQDTSDAKRQYKPLQEIANRRQVPIFCVTHLNAGGKVLGRRATEKVRVVIQMDCPDPEGQETRRKLWVEKSFDRKPPHLGITMGGEGNDYDLTPPETPGPPRIGGAKTGPLPVKTTECMAWLREQLAAGAARVSLLRRTGEAAGFSSTTLYSARDHTGTEEFEMDGKKWWRLAAAENANGNGVADMDAGVPF